MNVKQALKYASTDKKIIGLLFSADYCKYCHVFVPELRTVYKELQEHGIEIVFVASDKTKEAFEKYLSEHPWPAINYDDEIRPELRVMYNLKTIPALLFFDQEGNLIEREGRTLVTTSIQNDSDPIKSANAIATRLGLIECAYDSDNSDF